MGWLSEPGTAMASVISVNVWRGFPFFGISFLAGMKAVPGELYEAAAVDGATAPQRFRHVTLPGIRNIVIIVVLLSTIWTFNDFAIIYILTKGGPGGATQVLPVLTYEIAFGAQRLGEAIAVALYLLPGARVRDHRAGALHAPGPGAVSAGGGAHDGGRRPEPGRRERLQSAVSYAILLTFLLIVLFPFYWMTITSFKGENQMRSLVSMFWPSPFVQRQLRPPPRARRSSSSWYKNSIVVSVSSTLLATAIGTIGAYALARLRFLGRAFMASAVLITYLVPPSILFIPALRADPQPRAGRQPHRTDRRLPELHGPLRDLAPHGLLRVDSGGAGGVGDDRRRHAVRRLPPRSSCRWPRRVSWPPRSTRSPRPGTSSSTRWSSSPT